MIASILLGRKSSAPKKTQPPPANEPDEIDKEIDAAIQKMHGAVDKPLDTLSQKIRVTLADCEARKRRTT